MIWGTPYIFCVSATMFAGAPGLSWVRRLILSPAYSRASFSSLTISCPPPAAMRLRRIFELETSSTPDETIASTFSAVIAGRRATDSVATPPALGTIAIAHCESPPTVALSRNPIQSMSSRR